MLYAKAIQRLTTLCASFNSKLGLRNQIVIVNGFSRTGTTFVSRLITELFSFKEVFEPLDTAYNYECAHSFFEGVNTAIDRRWYYYQPENSTFIHRINEGKLPSINLSDYEMFRNRSGKHLLFPLQFCIKLCNAHAILDKINCPVIHIYRDSLETIDSIINSFDWGKELLQLDHSAIWKSADLKIRLDPVLEECLEDDDKIISLSALQCSLDMVAAHQLKNGLIVHYSDLLDFPEKTLSKIALVLKKELKSDLLFKQMDIPSGTTVKGRLKTNFTDHQEKILRELTSIRDDYIQAIHPRL